MTTPFIYPANNFSPSSFILFLARPISSGNEKGTFLGIAAWVTDLADADQGSTFLCQLRAL